MKAIIARNNNQSIGLNGELPWKSRQDLNHFKELTMDCKLLVGYTTSLKLPPLKGREIIVDDETKQIDYNEIDWCCGGKYTYEKFCHLFTELHVSIIDDDTVGDTIFPELSNLNLDCKVYYYNYQTDKEILKWYMQGFKDELHGTSSVESYSPTLNKAYKLGASHAIFGDEIKSVDQMTESQILNEILNIPKILV